MKPTLKGPQSRHHFSDLCENRLLLVKTVKWDLVAWNRAAAAVFRYGTLAPDDRNILRKIFFDPKVRAVQLDWQSVARFAVASFRAETARAGASAEVQALVEELRGLSPEFDAIWRENAVHAYGEGTKKLRYPGGGWLELEYSAFAVDGRPDLTLVLYNPATPKDAKRIRELVRKLPKRKRRE
jgi:hypothetical protein